MKHIILTLIALSLATTALAKANTMTECRQAGQMRVIEVIYTGEGEVPCEVTYTKESGTEVLWSAAGEVGYCEEKAAALVDKQRGWGWQCDEVINQ